MINAITHRIDALSPRSCAYPLVFFNGWGSNSGIWSGLIENLKQDFDLVAFDLPGVGENGHVGFGDLAEFESILIEMLPEKSVLIGWSLGGMLATRLALRFPERVVSLITLASNASFVATDNWPHAMKESRFAEFSQSFRADPSKCLASFIALQSLEDCNRKDVANQLKQSRLELDDKNLVAASKMLGFLKQIKNNASLDQIRQPQLHLFGEHDKLVPVASIHSFPNKSAIKVIRGASHAPHVSLPEQVSNHIREFLALGVLDITRNKRIAMAFSRAAPKYEEAARLQFKVAKKLVDMAPSQLGDWLDIGCGTGGFDQFLVPKGQYVGLDLAVGMLNVAQKQRKEALGWVCADMEKLPIKNNSFDTAFSSLSIQWSNLPNQTIAEMNRILKPGGVALVSSLGPNSLVELREAWRKLDNYVHVNQFRLFEFYTKLFEKNHFRIIESWREDIVLYYRSAMDLMTELKSIGARNVNYGQAKGLMTRQRIIQLEKIYDAYRTEDGLVPGSYETYFFLVEKIK